MYIVKVYTRVDGKRRLLNVQLFNNYEYALGEVINGDSELYYNLPEHLTVDFTRPHIVTESVNAKTGFQCDMEFLYNEYKDDEVAVYIGEPIIEDEEEEK